MARPSFFMNKLCSLASSLITVLLLFTVTSSQAAPPSETQSKLNDGYFLLYQLADNEDQLPLLFTVKHAPPELVDYAKQISRMAKETMADIERMQDKDHAIKFDHNPLPAMEQDTRASIKGDKQHQLLFGTTDAEFVRALLVSQIEASTYATNLAKVLADQETNPDRVKTLQHISAKWMKLRNQAYGILRNY